MSQAASRLVDFDPNKLLKVVARTVRINTLAGGTEPLPTPPRDPDADDPQSMKSLLERMMERARQEEDDAPCGLNIDQLSVCTEYVQENCSLRGADCCPRLQQRKRRKLRQDLRGESARRGIPERVLAAAWDQDPHETPALRCVQQFLNTDRSLLVLSGANQCGKTTAAGWAACAHPQFGGRERRTRYFTAAEATHPERSDEILRDLGSTSLVVLDDVGQAFFGASGFSLRQLEVIVDTVYRANARLIICTDIQLKQGDKMPFFELVGRRITARILQAGRCEASLGDAFKARKLP